MNDEMRAPFAASLRAYSESGVLAFYTPGHKQGLGAHPLLRDIVTDEGLREEISLMEEMGDIHQREGAIREAEELAAKLWGADAAFFMVNGTTGAIQTMMLATLSPGDEVLIPRNAHRSIISGLAITGAKPVYITPEADERLGILMGVTKEAALRAIEEHPAAKALMIVYPTYYGVAAELSDIVKIAHEHGLPVLVDEAHGAHLHFSDELPPDALSCGADLVAQSTHKLLGSFTQTSMLFCRCGRVDRERIRRSASLITSTSPNCLLLASLDIARLQMCEAGRELVGRAVKLAKRTRARINEIPGLWCFGGELMGKPGAMALDVTKLTVQVAGIGLTGMEAKETLRFSYGVHAELADAYNVLFLITMADTEQEADILVDALGKLAKEKSRAPRVFPPLPPAPLPKRRLTPREAFFASSEPMPFESALGRISAEEISFYPPGIPVLAPGEEITTELLDYIKTQAVLRLKITGPEDATLKSIRVIKE